MKCKLVSSGKYGYKIVPCLNHIFECNPATLSARHLDGCVFINTDELNKSGFNWYSSSTELFFTPDEIEILKDEVEESAL